MFDKDQQEREDRRWGGVARKYILLLRRSDRVAMQRVEITPLKIPEVLKIATARYSDNRGYFEMTYHHDLFRQIGINCQFLQDNQSLSTRAGTIRGLHYQIGQYSQAKLIRVLNGAAYCVALDLRHSSEYRGKWCAATLSSDSGDGLYLPRGFAHGLCTLKKNTIISYKVDNYYNPVNETGLLWEDPRLNVKWPKFDRYTISEKDRNWPLFSDANSWAT